MKANDFFNAAKQCLTHSKALNKIEIFQWLKKCLLWIFFAEKYSKKNENNQRKS